MLKQWIESHNFPSDVKKFIYDNIRPEPYELSAIQFTSSEGIMEWSGYEDWPNLLENKMIQIGSALNGDVWAIHFKDAPSSVIIISHDKMPSRSESAAIPDSAFAKVANSPDEFIKLAKEDKLPIDFYEAKNRDKQK